MVTHSDTCNEFLFYKKKITKRASQFSEYCNLIVHRGPTVLFLITKYKRYYDFIIAMLQCRGFTLKFQIIM